MNHRDYWRERSRVLEEAENRQGRECYEEIEQQYREAQRVIEGKIASWYQRFANNNGITMQQARQMLRGQELEEFRWEVSDYIRYGKENARTGAWMAQCIRKGTYQQAGIPETSGAAKSGNHVWESAGFRGWHNTQYL